MRSTMKAVNLSPSAWANTISMSAKPPLLIHIFSPFETPGSVGLPIGACLGGQRVGAGARLAERIGADHLAGDELAADNAPSASWRAEEHQRQRAEIGLSAEGGAERGRAGDAFDDDERRRLVEVQAAVLLGHAMPSRPRSAHRCQQVARERPVLVLETIEVRQHLVADELFGRLRDQPMLVGQFLRREDVCCRWLLEQPAAPLRVSVDGVVMDLEKTPGVIFSVWQITPVLLTVVRKCRRRPCRRRRTWSPDRSFDFRRFISYSSDVVSLAPVQPSGWPSAIAPPLTFTFSGSIGSSRSTASAWAAKASFSSIEIHVVERRASTTSAPCGSPAPARCRIVPARRRLWRRRRSAPSG